MNLNIKRVKEEIEDILKNNDISPASINIKYDWKLQCEESDETLEDLYLFCLSVVGDLLIEYDKELYEVNENEDDNEDKENNEDEYIDSNKFVLLKIEELFRIIALKKFKNDR